VTGRVDWQITTETSENLQGFTVQGERAAWSEWCWRRNHGISWKLR